VIARASPRRLSAALALAAAGCATESLVTDEPKAVAGLAIAPYEIHEECARLAAGDRIDYRFEAQAPVKFHIYYTEGLTFLAPVSREDVREHGGIFQVTIDKRYCLQWEAGQQGALLDYRIRLLRGAGSP
jgi:hypothetical protein